MSSLPPGWPEFKRGEPVSLEEMERVADTARTARRAQGLGGPPLASAGTFETQPGYRFGIWVRLTDWAPAGLDYPARYSIKEVFWNGLQWQDKDNGVEGPFIAREQGDGIHPVATDAPTGIAPPVGRIVWARLSDGPDDDGAPWVFAAPSPRFGTFARLTASSGDLCSWKEMYRDSGDWHDKVDGLTGTSNAVEANGLTGFAVGADDGDVVWLWLAWPSPTSPVWVFFCTTCASGTTEPCTGCGGWIAVPGYYHILSATVTKATGACACVPIVGNSFLLHDYGGYFATPCWESDPLAGSFQTCMQDSVYEEDHGLSNTLRFCLDPADNWQPSLQLLGTFYACDGSTVTDPYLAFDCCTCDGAPVAYFRGGGCAFCNGDITHGQPCDDTFVVAVSLGGVLGCCAVPMPPGLFLNITFDDPDVQACMLALPAARLASWATCFPTKKAPTIAGDMTLHFDIDYAPGLWYEDQFTHEDQAGITSNGTAFWTMRCSNLSSDIGDGHPQGWFFANWIGSSGDWIQLTGCTDADGTWSATGTGSISAVDDTITDYDPFGCFPTGTHHACGTLPAGPWTFTWTLSE